ncbi:unnamed protein product, partial [Vitis vinifera]|eukprot:XP_010652718.1 PREDICTED: uncharacterized protein LOC104879911 [Vitis vinifera]
MGVKHDSTLLSELTPQIGMLRMLPTFHDDIGYCSSCAVLQQLGVLRYGLDLACIIGANREVCSDSEEGFLRKCCGENEAVAQQKLRKPGVECGIGPLALFLWHPVSIPPTP